MHVACRSAWLLSNQLEKPAARAGAQLRELLAVGSAAAQQAVFAARQANARWNPASATSRLPEGWAEFLALNCACLAALQEGKRVEAYEKVVAALQPFLKVSMPPLQACVRMEDLTCAPRSFKPRVLSSLVVVLWT